MTYPRVVLINWLALLLAGLYSCQAMPARAGEWYLDASAGASHFFVTAHPGDYVQTDLPHSFDRNGLAYRLELGWKFNDRWSIQGGYLDLGTLKQEARFVDDPDYNSKTNKCIAKCGEAVPNKITNAYKGLELTLSRTIKLDDNWGVFLKGGGAWIKHKISVTRLDTAGFHELTGEFPAAVVGLGASYQWLYLEANYILGLGGNNSFAGYSQSWPLSKEILVAWAGVKVPFAAW